MEGQEEIARQSLGDYIFKSKNNNQGIKKYNVVIFVIIYIFFVNKLINKVK